MLLIDVICFFFKETTSGESNKLATQSFEFDQFSPYLCGFTSMSTYMKNTLLHVF